METLRLYPTHLLLILLLIAAARCMAASANPPESTQPIRFQSGQLSLDVAATNGALLRIENASSKVALAPAPDLAENYRLVLLQPDKSTCTILGKEQKLSRSENRKGKLSLFWNGPLKDTGGASRDLDVRMDVAASSGSLEFTLHVTNRTQYKVQQAWYPLIGGLSDFASKEKDAVLWVPTSQTWAKPLTEPFENAAFAYPGQMNMSFTCIQSKSLGKSLYFASQDTIARYKCYHFMQGGGGKDLFACIQHWPFTAPGKSFDGSPVALRVVDGDWRAAGQVYRNWFIKTFGLADPKQDWIRRQSFYLFTMFMLPEGTINYTFKDIPRWADAAKEHGLGAVQISGWQLGGHDNGYPAYLPDPHLGTWKELEEGVRYCHKLGLKVYFFVNYQPVMLQSDWYKNELQKYREMAADGGLTWNAGWGMGTLAARMGHFKAMTWADPAFPQFREIIVDQFAKLAAIGGDGVHVDKMFPTAIDYNPDIPMSPDTATWEGAILLTKEIMAACRKLNPDWAMSFECNWDRLLQFGGCTWWVNNQRITRSVFPENAETLAITSAYDYLGINNAVRDGHEIMLAAMSFARGIEWPPFAELADYVRDVKLIRDRLQETVFFGDVMGHDGVRLAAANASGIDYNVFRNRKNGRRVCILTNSSREAQVQKVEAFDGSPSQAVRVHTPGRKSYTVRLPAAIQIPGERVVFVEELASASGVPAAEPAIKHATAPVVTTIPNGNFESGTFDGWTADPNWVVVDNSCRYYSGWQGKYWAWSGGTGEAAVGKLTSKPFVLDNDAVRLLISGWDSVSGAGTPRRWNYVTLNLEDGTEIDRVYAPNTTQFVPAWLDGRKHRGKKVYIQAVDDADQPAYSMLCIDDVRTAALPAEVTEPAPALPAFDAAKSLRLENDALLVEVSRDNGSITRIHDKTGDLDLILEPRLAGSWKFALPLPGKEPWQTIEANWLVGAQQKLTSGQVEGGKITLQWNGPLKNYLGDPYDVSVTQTIELSGEGLLFSLHVDNRAQYQVGETYFPILGGLCGLGHIRAELKSTLLVRPAAKGTTVTADIFRSFGNMSPFGDQGPELWYAYPDPQPEPWAGLSCPKLGRSVYIGPQDPADRKTVLRLELLPSNSGTIREDGNWPRPEELNGLPAGVELSFVDCAGGPVGKSYDAAPVLVRFLQGGAPEIADVYMGWKKSK